MERLIILKGDKMVEKCWEMKSKTKKRLSSAWRAQTRVYRIGNRKRIEWDWTLLIFLQTRSGQTTLLVSFQTNSPHITIYLKITIFKLIEIWAPKEIALFETCICRFGKRFQSFTYYVPFLLSLTQTIDQNQDSKWDYGLLLRLEENYSLQIMEAKVG